MKKLEDGTILVEDENAAAIVAWFQYHEILPFEAILSIPFHKFRKGDRIQISREENRLSLLDVDAEEFNKR